MSETNKNTIEVKYVQIGFHSVFVLGLFFSKANKGYVSIDKDT